MRKHLLIHSFTALVLLPVLLPTTPRAEEASAATGQPPTHVVAFAAQDSALFSSDGRLVTVSDASGRYRISPDDYRHVAIHEIRGFDPNRGNLPVVRIPAFVPDALAASLPANLVEDRVTQPDSWLPLAGCADGSLFLSVENRKWRATEGPRSRHEELLEVVLYSGDDLGPLDYFHLRDFRYLGVGNDLNRFSISPDGNHAAIWGEVRIDEAPYTEKRLLRLDLAGGRIRALDQGVPFPGRIAALRSLDDGSTFVACDRQVITGDASRPETFREEGYHRLAPDGSLELIHAGYLRGDQLALSPHGKWLAAIAPDGSGEKVLLFDTGSPSKLIEIPHGPIDDPAITFSPDGRHLAIGTRGENGKRESSRVLLWNIASGKRDGRFDIAPLETDAGGRVQRDFGAPSLIRFSPDGKWMSWQRLSNRENFYCLWPLKASG